MKPVREYYEALAATYDESRFGNSYGQYIDALERHVLVDWLTGFAPDGVVDLGCGTGRLLDRASTGVDAAGAMLAEARRKHPDRRLVQAEITATGLAPASFDAAICFHVFMHLDAGTIGSVLREAARIVRPAGRLVFDIPSRPRRDLGRRPPSGWHGDTSATIDEARSWCGAEWRLVRWRGIVFVPIHRVPPRWRRPLGRLDALIGATPAARWSSYYICELERR